MRISLNAKNPPSSEHTNSASACQVASIVQRLCDIEVNGHRRVIALDVTERKSAFCRRTMLYAILCYVVPRELMHRVPLDRRMADHEYSSTIRAQAAHRFFQSQHSSRSSSPSLRSLLPPNLVNRPLQRALHRSLAKRRNVIVSRRDILLKVSEMATKSGSSKLTINHSGFTVVTVRM